jgi:hypothetical protein
MVCCCFGGKSCRNVLIPTIIVFFAVLTIDTILRSYFFYMGVCTEYDVRCKIHSYLSPSKRGLKKSPNWPWSLRVSESPMSPWVSIMRDMFLLEVTRYKYWSKYQYLRAFFCRGLHSHASHNCTASFELISSTPNDHCEAVCCQQYNDPHPRGSANNHRSQQTDVINNTSRRTTLQKHKNCIQRISTHDGEETT